jgi:tRNA(fMet)-specific endonuclease VapC
MYLLDNDVSSLFLRGHQRVVERLLATPPERMWLSSIAAEEMLVHGNFAAINRERSRSQFGLEQVYQDLIDAIEHLARFNILPYSDDAERLYRSWPASVKRVGTYDCRTAALAITKGLIVVTGNTRDFSRIPGCQFEDWTR